MILVNELSKTFGKGKNQKTVLNNVSWSAPNGMITGLFGRKDSGKTVAIRIITGIQSASHGKVHMDSWDITTDIVETRKTFGYVPPSTDQFLGLKGEEYLNFAADIYEVEEEKRRRVFDAYLEPLHLELELEHRMSTYSVGVYKKMMLLGALIYSPVNLILDNIFDGLGAADQEAVKKILKDYADRGNAVLFSGDRLSLAQDLCSHVVYLTGGTVKFEGSLWNLREKYGELSNLDLIDLKLNGELDQLAEKEQTEREIRLWGGA